MRKCSMFHVFGHIRYVIIVIQDHDINNESLDIMCIGTDGTQLCACKLWTGLIIRIHIAWVFITRCVSAEKPNQMRIM